MEKNPINGQLALNNLDVLLMVDGLSSLLKQPGQEVLSVAMRNAAEQLRGELAQLVGRHSRYLLAVDEKNRGGS